MTGSEETVLSRPEASAAAGPHGWRYLLGDLHTNVEIGGLAEAAQVASSAIVACGADADGHLRLDLHPTRVELRLQTASIGRVTARDVELAAAVTAALGGRTSPSAVNGRGLQTLELAIDALDIASIRPFWAAVLDYVDEAGTLELTAGGLIDPLGTGPSVWFQQMDAPRPQRNRIHFDLTVPHDEAPRRIAAALKAGGVLVSDAAARAFWILADAEGNEVCVCTWQDRDPT